MRARGLWLLGLVILTGAAACTAISGLDGLTFDGPDAPCATLSDCDDGNACTTDLCDPTGRCTHAAIPDGVLPDDVLGDCARPACQGGAIVSVALADDDDDNEACTADSCDDKTPVHAPLADGTSCMVGGHAGQCNTGRCAMGCAADKDCDDGNACTKNVCDAGFCRFPPDDTGVPDLGECAIGSCSFGVKIATPAPLGEVCATGFCDGAGSCVACNQPADCGADTECARWACESSKCVAKNVAKGTPLSIQVPGDCKRIECDGAGATQMANDDLDLPDDHEDCTDDTCNQGAPGHTDAMNGAKCGNGLSCDGNGACTGCLTEMQCPPADACSAPVCTAGVCLRTFTPDDTVIASQVTGDCKERRCDGQGNTKEVVLATDLPPQGADPCQAAACDGGEIATIVAFDAACSPPANGHCDASGACVACTAPAECPVAPACSQPACTNGVCGTTGAPLGTPLDAASQTAGDCQLAVCDGNGGQTTAPFAFDPEDDKNECTLDTCDGKSPKHANAAGGAPCGSAMKCDGLGHCM